jgi:hypothetical protein
VPTITSTKVKPAALRLAFEHDISK